MWVFRLTEASNIWTNQIESRRIWKTSNKGQVQTSTGKTNNEIRLIEIWEKTQWVWSVLCSVVYPKDFEELDKSDSTRRAKINGDSYFGYLPSIPYNILNVVNYKTYKTKVRVDSRVKKQLIVNKLIPETMIAKKRTNIV